MNADPSTKTAMELAIQLVDTIVWPVTLLLIVFLFRHNLSEVILRLGTLKADSSGFEISFQKQIEATKKLFQEIKPTVYSKSAQDIEDFTAKNDSPFADILASRSKLINYLRMTAETEGIVVTDQSPELIVEKLKETGAISLQQSRMIMAMLNVTAAANPTATPSQAKEIGNLMKQIEIY